MLQYQNAVATGRVLGISISRKISARTQNSNTSMTTASPNRAGVVPPAFWPSSAAPDYQSLRVAVPNGTGRTFTKHQHFYNSTL